MKIRKRILKVIKRNNRIKSLLALEFGKSIYTIERWIDINDDCLTKAASLKIIREETGLGLTDAEILEESTEKERA